MLYNKPIMSHITLVVLALFFMLPGLLGVLLPAIPGVPYMFVVALVFGFVDRFAHLTGRELGWLAALAILSLVVDYTAGLLGAKLGGASKKAAAAGFMGLLLGTLLLPPIGGFIGLFAGVLFAELTRGQDERQALKAATGSVLGSLAGIAINLGVGLLLALLFLFFALR